MISSQRIFVLFILIFFSCRETLTAKIDSKIPKIVFSEITIAKHLFNEENYQSLYFSCLIPKKIFHKELEKFYLELGNIEKEKKILSINIQSKGESLLLKTSVIKKNRSTRIYVTDLQSLSNERSIRNLLVSFQKILQRKFLNDYIKEIESNIKKIDKQQNKIIRNNPKNLEMNLSFFYKIFQKKEAKKIALKAALEKLYKELEETKKAYNSIK